MTHTSQNSGQESVDTAELLSAITTTGASSVFQFYQFLGNEIMRPGAVKENPEWFLACGKLLADRVLGPKGGTANARGGDDRALMELIDSSLKQFQK